MLLLRLSAWVLHSLVDGVVVSTARNATMAFQIALPVTVCGLLDVSALSLQIGKLGATRAELLACVCTFALGFPLGASIGSSWHSAGNHAISMLRVFTCGVFLYIGAFELAPPHAHGWRAQMLGYIVFFAGFTAASI